MQTPIILYQPANCSLLFTTILGSSNWPPAKKQFTGGVSGVYTIYTSRSVCAQWRIWPKSKTK
jgi:hypothetical protein